MLLALRARRCRIGRSSANASPEPTSVGFLQARLPDRPLPLFPALQANRSLG